MAQKKTSKDYSYKFKPQETYTITAFKGGRSVLDGEEAFQTSPVAPITILGSMLISSRIETVQDYLTHPDNPFPTNKTIHFLIKDFDSGIYNEVGSGNPLKLPKQETLADNVASTTGANNPATFVFPHNTETNDKIQKDIINSYSKNYERERMISAEKEKEVMALLQKHNSEQLKLQQELLDTRAQLSAAEAKIAELRARVEVYEQFVDPAKVNPALADKTQQPTTFEKVMTVATPFISSPEFMAQASGILEALKNKISNTSEVPQAPAPAMPAYTTPHAEPMPLQDDMQAQTALDDVMQEPTEDEQDDEAVAYYTDEDTAEEEEYYEDEVDE